MKLLPVMAVVLGLAAPAACGGKKVTECADGQERCPCYGNGSCDLGLSCQSDLCVAPFGAGGHGGEVGATGGAGGGAPLGTGGGLPGTGGGLPGSGGGGPAGTGGTTPGTGGAAPAAPNLIKNGDFTLGKTYWDLTYQAGQIASETYVGGTYCVTNESGTYYLSFSLGYPPTPSDAFPIEAGAQYVLSYKVKGYGSLMVKIGQASPPYAAIASVEDTAASPSYESKAHLISPAIGDATAGLVFNGVLYYYETVCFDDVILVKAGTGT
jgi:hypothetical protein